MKTEVQDLSASITQTAFPFCPFFSADKMSMTDLLKAEEIKKALQAFAGA